MCALSAATQLQLSVRKGVEGVARHAERGQPDLNQL